MIKRCACDNRSMAVVLVDPCNAVVRRGARGMQDPSVEAEAQPAARAASPWANLALLLLSLAVSLVFIEAGYRVAAGLPVLKLTNWRIDQVSTNRLGERAVFDPVIGWSLKPGTDIDGLETVDYGIRRNSTETTIRTGAALAVGDSFTEGWEVEDEESWPAVLEKMTGVPIVNAGVGGYGTDQIVMRAEQLLPIVRSEARRVGKEWSARWEPSNKIKR